MHQGQGQALTMAKRKHKKVGGKGTCFDKNNKFVKCSSPKAVRKVPRRRKRK